MDQQLREIEGLLETSAHPDSEDLPTKIKKYVKLVLPHVALVAVVCLYAVIGAYIFYRLESPNEDRLKSVGKALIGDMRNNLIAMIRDGRGSKEVWKDSIEGELYRFNDKIYKAFKEQYVRYADVRITPNQELSLRVDDSDRPKRHRNNKLRGEKGEKMWTASSALFFAATTMATIGYGNIVPATSSGRIACVVFALFGAPLAIITIGDLGKFLSECTIWLYKEMKKVRTLLYGRWRRFRGLNKEHEDAESQLSSSRSLDWEDLVLDKTEVPVIMVFTILLLYIAFGGVLFSFLEGWTYMDAFYYSFISLTTIGFGDIVPENHDYIVLMLAYLGIGLAVTTMCIDLVGIQYIQKIHYFGRKFRGTDLLHLLKRKRMIERRLAMGQGEEILQMYIQQMQNQLPDPVVVEQQWEEDKASSHIEWQIDDALISSYYSFDFPLAIRVPSPNVLSIRSYRPPSIYSNSSASARSLMLKRLWESRGESWDESGPSISEHCSLSTEPSVHIRQAYWDDYQSPTSSVLSFDYEVPLPSPDYQKIALSARRSRRLRSCPSGITVPPSQSPVGVACMEDWDSYIRMLESYNKPYERVIHEPLPTQVMTASSQDDTIPTKHFATPARLKLTPTPVTVSSPPTTPPPLKTPPTAKFPSIVRTLASLSPSLSSLSLSMSPHPPSPPPVSPTPPPKDPTPPPRQSPPPVYPVRQTPTPPRLPTPETPPADPQLTTYVMPSTFRVPTPPREPSPPRIHVPMKMPTPPVTAAPVFVEVLTEFEVVPEEHENLIEHEEPEETTSPPQTDSSSEEENANGMDLDLGAFELVDSGMTAETLLSTEEPVIYHRDLPVHSVHHDTVQTEAALANLMSAPSSMLTAAIPPTMVEDNYCFVVDGERVRMGDILGDDQWWRHTSRPTKYFYSEDLRQFHRVNCIAVKGKVIAAKLATSALQVQTTATGVASSASTPRSSVSGASARSHGRDNKVPLAHVYKVIRFYSFWKTCTSFHRIVTMIDRVTDDRNVNPDFKKRLFVQYLWRNAKAVEKARVQKEFDPRRQRLLRFVTDPAARKRFQKL
ncbi:hypothetical protein V3C99_012571 [Haemonchus contortus]